MKTQPEKHLADRMVGEIVAEQPGRSRIFDHFQIGYCCQGKLTLAEACKRKGIPVEWVVEELEEEAAAGGEENPAALAPEELIHHIVEKHHGFLRQELPRLHAMAYRVAQVHGEHQPSLLEVFAVFADLFEELDSHMRKEEQVLFPAILQKAETGHTSLSFTEPIARMIEEHKETGELLDRLRKLTNSYKPPPEACNTYRALFGGLEELEQDLHLHIHLENSVLFPAVERLAVVA